MKLPFVILTTALFSLSLVVRPDSASAQESCTHVVGSGEQYQSIEGALASIGSNAAGKVICIRNNKNYGNENITVSGTAASPLVIKGHPSNTGKPKFSSTNSGQVINVSGSYVNLHDVEVTSAPNADGIEVINTHHVNLYNVKVSNTKGHGIQVYQSDYVNIDGCEVIHATQGGNGAGENVRANHKSKYVTIKNCFITDDWSQGVGGVLNVGQSDYVTVSNNELFFNQSNNLHLGNGDHVVFENNLVSTTCAADSGTGLYRMPERYDWYNNPPYKNTDIKIRNNLIVKMEMGLSLLGCQDNSGSVCPFRDAEINNNTIVGIGIPSSSKDDKDYALNLTDQDHPVDVNNVRIFNNIFHTFNGNTADYNNNWEERNNIMYDGNLWSDLTGVPAQGNTLVTNWNSVFSNSPNITTCQNTRVNPNDYQVSNAFAGKGADVSRVGIGRGGGTPPPSSSPSSNPSPSPSTSPSPPPSWDLNSDGKTNAYDFAKLKKGIGSMYDLFQIKIFLAEFL